MEVDPQDYYNSRNLFINIIIFILISENRRVIKFLYFRLLCLFSGEHNIQKRVLTVVF